MVISAALNGLNNFLRNSFYFRLRLGSDNYASYFNCILHYCPVISSFTAYKLHVYKTSKCAKSMNIYNFFKCRVTAKVGSF